jgi:serine/threonine protein kinase
MNAPSSGAGDRLGRYTLVKRIASGGMAEIFVASTDAGSDGVDQLVAIKRILPEHARNREFLTMFMNEARVAATLRHPNVVRAYDFGSENGTYYLAMEYLRGLDMRRIVQTLALAGKKLPLEIALASAIGIAAGLHYVHEKRDQAGQPLGLVHRDISPQNVFLTIGGGVKLVDFGVVKAVHRASNTLSGIIKGKVPYMSPEQVRSKGLDRRSDVFSLSIVLWELTVGRRLFEGVSEAMVMNAIEELNAPAPSQMTPRYPPDLERIVMKGLSRERNHRYQTAEEMRLELAEFARERRLDVTAEKVSSFVRWVISESQAANVSPGPSPVQREWERALRRGQTPEPKGLPAEPTPAPLVRSRRALWFAALGLLAVAGFGAAWFAGRPRPADRRPPAAASPVIGLPSETAPMPPPPKPPAAIEEDLSDPLPAPTAREPHRDRKGGGHTPRSPPAPKAAP